MAKSQLIVEEKNMSLNIVKWVLAFLMLLAGIVINYHYVATPASIRASVGIVLVCVVLLVLATTSQGVRVRHFLQSVRVELRKVVWPTREETVRMTMIIIAIVIVLSLVIWGVDVLFLNLIRMITVS
jgi:preprotein translocase subunit SecE